MSVLRIIAFVCLTYFASASWSASAAGDIIVERAWSRATIGTDGPGVVYMTVRNESGIGDFLLGAASPVARSAEVHETRSDADGMMSMVPVATVAIPAHGQADFAPNGLHLMLVGLGKPLTLGQHFVVDLTFQHAGAIRVMVRVQKAGARGFDDAGGM
jgi:copper(I)-binding protein